MEYKMKIFTHVYRIEIYSNGKFCWRNHGWLEKGINDYKKDRVFDFIVIMALALMVIFAN